ncbi:hypothetical protein OAM67_00505 [bacterium]|nr:hypothetical protein [bacterium]
MPQRRTSQQARSKKTQKQRQQRRWKQRRKQEQKPRQKPRQKSRQKSRQKLKGGTLPNWCSCGPFKWKNIHAVIIAQWLCQHPRYAVGEKIGGGYTSVAYECGIKGGDPCMVLHIREVSKLQSGGERALRKAMNYGVTGQFLGPFLARYRKTPDSKTKTYQLTLMQRLGRVVSTDDIAESKDLILQYAALCERIGNAGIIHDDETTPGNILACKDRLCFVDFNDTHHTGRSLLIDDYRSDIPLDLWEDYMGLDTMERFLNVNEFLQKDPHTFIAVASFLRGALEFLQQKRQNKEVIAKILTKLSKGKLEGRAFVDSFVHEYLRNVKHLN